MYNPSRSKLPAVVIIFGYNFILINVNKKWSLGRKFCATAAKRMENEEQHRRVAEGPYGEFKYTVYPICTRIHFHPILEVLASIIRR